MNDVKRGQPSNSPWRDPALCARVKVLWEVHTATEIASIVGKEFNVPVTRNSIIGFLNRENLTIENKREVHRQTRTKGIARPPVRPTPVNIQKIRQARAAPRPKPDPLVPVCVEIVPLNLTFDQLSDSVCKFAYGDVPADFVFCGHPAASGRAWCADHMRLVFAPTPPRRQSAGAPRPFYRGYAA